MQRSTPTAHNLAIASLLAASTAALAQDESNQGHTSLSFGIDFTNDYYFRGIVQEDDGFISQPWIEVGLDLWSNDETSLDLTFGTWNSFHDTDTGISGDEITDRWYEADVYAGLGIEHGDWSGGISYMFYTSPSNAWGSIQEVAFSISYDDSEALEEWAMSPSITLAWETGSNAADGGEQGIYLELGISPGFSVDLSEDTPLDVSIPVTLGLSLSNYYEDAAGDDDFFGFFQVGIEGSIPLPVNPGYGQWSLTAGIHALVLGDTTSEYNSDDDIEAIFALGVSVDY